MSFPFAAQDGDLLGDFKTETTPIDIVSMYIEKFYSHFRNNLEAYVKQV